MALLLDLRRNAADGRLHEGDVCPDAAVAAGENPAEPAPVIGQHQGEPVQLPAQPDRPIARPLLQVLHLLGLGQREGRIFMSLLLAGDVVLGRGVDLLCRAVRQDHAGLLLQPGQLVKERIPFEVGHDLVPSAVIRLRGLVQPPDHLFHSVSFKLCHHCRSCHSFKLWSFILCICSILSQPIFQNNSEIRVRLSLRFSARHIRQNTRQRSLTGVLQSGFLRSDGRGVLRRKAEDLSSRTPSGR